MDVADDANAMDVADDRDSTILVPGRRCALIGLQNKPELNGREVAILEWVPETSRFAVELMQNFVAIKHSDGRRRSAGHKFRLAVRSQNLACKLIDFRLRLQENDELLAGALLPHLDIVGLCTLRACDSTLAPLVRSELSRRPMRRRFERDWHTSFEDDQPDSYRAALFDRAWESGGFAADNSTHWFGCSSDPRPARPAELRFRVGDLFQHQSTGYLGYVLAWDARTRAPREWVEAHRRVDAPGTRVDRLFAPHLSVREFLPVPTDQGVGFQSRYVIADNLAPFNPDGLGMAEAQALQDDFCKARAAARLPPAYLWRVLNALSGDGRMLEICAEVSPHDQLGVLSSLDVSSGSSEAPGNARDLAFERVEGRIAPKKVPPRGEEDLVFRGSGKLVPSLMMKQRYPQDVSIKVKGVGSRNR